MRCRRSSPLLALLALSITPGCADITYDRWPSQYVVGQVTDQRGAPVSGADIILRTFEGECGGTGHGWNETRTQPSGRSSTGFASTTGFFQGCLELRVTPPYTSSLGPDTIRVPNLKLEMTGADSIRVDIVLLPAVGATQSAARRSVSDPE